MVLLESTIKQYKMKKLLLSVISLLVVGTVIGQSLESTYENLFTGEFVELGKIHVDDNDNYYIGGRATGPFNIGLETSELFPESTYRELYVGKYNSANELQWQILIDGTTNSNQLRGIATDDQGAVYVTGAFVGTLQFTEDGQNELTSFGSTSMYLAKYSSEGEFQWMFKVGESNWSQYPIFIDIVNNRIAVSMVYTGTVDIDPSSNTVNISGNNSDAFIEYSLNGDYISRRIYGGDSFLRDVEYREDGSYVTCGSFGQSGFDINFNGTTNISGDGSSNGFLASYSSNDQLLWYTTLDASFSTNIAYEVAVNSKNEIIVAGNFEGVDIEGEEADEMYYILKYDSDGNLIDSKKLSDNIFVVDLQVDSEDRVWLVSSFNDDYSIMDNGQEITFVSVEDNSNHSIMIFDDELNYLDGDQISSDRIWANGLLFNSNDEALVCNSVTSSGNLYYSTDEEANVMGSDNITIQFLTLGSCTDSEMFFNGTICEGESFTIGSEVYTESGEYSVNFENSQGCDSIITLSLAVMPSSIVDLNVSICEGESYEFGSIIATSSGVFTNVLSNSQGCDSIINLSLTVIANETIDVIQEEDQLSTNFVSDSYQWFDCTTDTPIEGATESVFNPIASGSYYVEANGASCYTGSECYDIILTSVYDAVLESTLVYPNPTHDKLTVENTSYSIVSAQIIDLNGRVLLNNTFQFSTSIDIDISNLEVGMYHLILNAENGDSVIKKVLKM